MIFIHCRILTFGYYKIPIAVEKLECSERTVKSDSRRVGVDYESEKSMHPE